MSAYGDAKSHTLAIGMRKIRQCNLRLRSHGNKVSALPTVPEGFDQGARRPPHPGATVREICTPRVDPTAIRKGIDVSRCLPFTARWHSCGGYTTFHMTQVREGVTSSRHAEPVNTYSCTLFAEPLLEVGGLS